TASARCRRRSWGGAPRGGPVDHIAAAHGCTPSTVALSWLLHRSDVVLPIPGTSKVAHLEENLAAARLHLTEAELAELTAAA
uniref:aldo/keto reductase n=1 Tax=Amycolatopsis solani TaxID=3028615 RepID=UPI0025B23481